MKWFNEEDIFAKGRIKKDIRNSISPYEMLMYSIKFAIPFEAFRNIFSLSELFKTLEEMEQKGENITHITSKTLLIESIEDIQMLNEFAQKESSSNFENFIIKFSGTNIFNYGDLKSIGKKFPYSSVNYFEIKDLEQMLSNPRDYKGVKVIVTIDNIGELSLEKLNRIENLFDVKGIRIIEKDREISRHTGEQTPYNINDYKKIRKLIDDEIISKLYINENLNKRNADYQLATQVLYRVNELLKYNSDIKKNKVEAYTKKMISASGLLSLLEKNESGNAICIGYSETIRNVLSCAGIESKVVIGKTTDGIGHAWNKIKLGDIWFNADATLARKEISEGKPTGDLFMSDKAFFGARREMIFQEGMNKDVEIKTVIGGHVINYSTEQKQCEFNMPLSITTALIQASKTYEDEYEKGKNIKDYKGVIPYIGSNVEKQHMKSKNMELYKSHGEH